MALRNRFAKAGAAAASVAIAVLATAGPAFAISSGGTASPSNVPTVAVFNGGNYQGDAGTVTVTIPNNTTLTANQGVFAEECNTGPTSQGNCDGLTLVSNDVNGRPMRAGPSGAVTLTFSMFILPTGNSSTAPDVTDPNNPTPQGFDPGSTLTCNSSSPCAIWVGDSTANWPSGYVFDGITEIPNSTPLPTTTTTTVATTTTTVPTTTSTVATTTTTVPTTTTTLATTTTTAATTTTTAATTTTTLATTTTTAATTSTSLATTTTTAPTTTTVPTTLPTTTSTTTPGQGQVPESPSVPALPLAAAGVVGGGFFIYLFLRRRNSRNV